MVEIEENSETPVLDLPVPHIEAFSVFGRTPRQVPDWRPGMPPEWHHERKRLKQGRCVATGFCFYPPNDTGRWPRTVGEIGRKVMDKLLAYVSDEQVVGSKSSMALFRLTLLFSLSQWGCLRR
jgi:hypothetical protein